MLLTRYPVTFRKKSGLVLQMPRGSAGVNGFSHRYMSQDIEPAPGAVAGVWADYVGGAELAGVNGPTVRAMPDGRKYLEFDGANDTLQNRAMEDGSVKTVVAVVRSRATDDGTTILLAGDGVSVNRAGTLGTMINPGTGIRHPTSLDGQWRVVVATAAADAASLTIDGVKVPVAPKGIWGKSLVVGANGTPNYFSKLDAVEIITYPNVLTDSEAAKVRTAMQAAYPDLLV